MDRAKFKELVKKYHCKPSLTLGLANCAADSLRPEIEIKHISCFTECVSSNNGKSGIGYLVVTDKDIQCMASTFPGFCFFSRNITIPFERIVSVEVSSDVFDGLVISTQNATYKFNAIDNPYSIRDLITLK